ncbi:ExeM/NucH family extracellular endonuclease [Roseomonas sp. HJA6]|uniref:ExeM/NucH family extracellular endonuclease n=1 Tax=Roseomonas alba TaxID=2846776 RepID=A0ABS7A9K7_9PROT|nr:ExeM/NucH family extracellular endonuclease [Neoroseomonas alba]MBW6398432.1 ExeM/NucH family extracellular endonuclease [Neoroseomonas alba]
MSTTYHVLATADFSQDWSNTGLIATNDDWSGVASIMGYRGDELTASTGTDPRTLTAADAGLVVDVNANQTNPDTYTAGGVTEFELTDPTIALNGSGTADAPYLVLFMNTLGRSEVTLSFNLRDVDGSADDATQQVAVQYRIGETGDWTNAPGGYVADATSGPSLATLVTPVTVVLPEEAVDQAQLQIRIITANAPGNDEWVGIDDIAVTSAPAGAPVETLSIAAASADKAEGDAGTTEFTFTVTRANGDGEAGATWTLSAPGGASEAAADDFAGPLTGTIAFAEGETEQTITVTVSGDTASEGDETFAVALSDPTGGAVIGTAIATGTIRNDDLPITKISTVQGAGEASGMVGQTVTIEAIVIGDFQNGDADAAHSMGGFFLQEEDTDADGNAATSEGLYVFANVALGDVAIGDKVLVTGTVSEYFGLTQLNATSVSVVSSGHDLPTAAVIELPAEGVTLNQNGAYQPDLEAYEGMRVTIPQTLTISEQFNLDRSNEIRLVAGEREASFTQDNDPSVEGYAQHLQDLGARTIVYDDGQNAQNLPIGGLDGFGPSYDAATAPRMGDQVTDLSGVLDYQWAGFSGSGSTWRIRSTVDGENSFDRVTERPETPPDVGGTLQVASFNVLNFFPTLNSNPGDDSSNSDPSDNIANGMDSRGANNPEEYARQFEKLMTTLSTIHAEVIGLVELENDFLPGASGNAIETIVNGLNSLEGAEVWSWVNPDTRFLGGDAIAVGIIYRNDAVRLADGTSIATLTDTDLAGLGLQSLIDDSTVGGVFDGANTSRVPLAATFEDLDSGETFTVAVNHFKSKSGSGTGADADILDGQGSWTQQREAAATALSAWLDTDPTGSGNDNVLILGDLNAYAREDAMGVLKGAGYVDLEAPGEHTYVFDGQTGSLDHALSSEGLAGAITGAEAWAINADEADALDYNTDFGRDPAIFDGNTPYRTSDHDPLVIGLDFTPITSVAFALTEGGAKAAALLYRAEEGEGVEDSAAVNDSTGATTGRFRQEDGEVRVLAIDPAGSLRDMQARLSWQEDGVATLRDTSGGGVDGVLVTDFVGHALKVQGFASVTLTATRDQDVTLRVVDANETTITTGAGHDDITIAGEVTSLWRPSQVAVDGGAGDDRITLDLARAAPALAATAQAELAGGAGNDTILGSVSADTIDGGAGADDLSGRGGQDIFVLRAGEVGGDIIRDFGALDGVALDRDALRLEGFAPDAMLENAGGDLWSVGGETFQLAGVLSLGQVDYAFA